MISSKKLTSVDN